VGKSNERDRRPTQDELNRLIEYAECNPLQLISLGRIIRFAVGTAMRQAEICRIEWSDVDLKKRMVTIRDSKDPRRNDGKIVAILNSTGYDVKIGGFYGAIRISNPTICTKCKLLHSLRWSNSWQRWLRAKPLRAAAG
jgi:hypothetical protein